VAHPFIYGMRQLRSNPPVFQITIKGKRRDVLHTSYLHFLENRLRERFGFKGVPIRIISKTSKK